MSDSNLNTKNRRRPERGDSELFSTGFLGLTFTQLLTGTNDNIFRWLVIGVAKDFVSESSYGNILMAGTACFVLPYLVLAAPAGYLADRFSKRSVIIACKLAEIAIMSLGLVAIWMGSLTFLFGVVALMGAQSALFAPAKMGSIPELLKPKHISAANGVFGAMSVVATLVGMVIGNLLTDWTGHRGQEQLWISAVVLLGVAVVGWLCSLLIGKRPAANPQRHFPWDAPLQTWRDLRTLASNVALLRVALGIMFFWSVGALGQLNIDQLAFEGGAEQEADKIPLLVCIVIGLGVGSVLAGVLSGGRVELGLLPLGAGGMALGGMLLFTVPDQLMTTFGMIWACVLLLFLGTGAGMFDVPLEAFLQHRSPARQRGSLLAASNFLTFGGILVSAGLFSLMRLPVHEGSQENVAALAAVRLSGDEEKSVATAEAEFSEAWKRGEPQAVESQIANLDGDLRTAMQGRLLWQEYQLRRADGEAVLRNVEMERFPDDRALVRDVVVQSGALPLFTSRQIFLIVGVFTVLVVLYIVWLIPQATTRFIVLMLSRLFYRIRVHGIENLPNGGALLAPNHVSWLDGFLLLLVSERPIRMVVWAGNFQAKWLKRWAHSWGAIMIVPRPKAIVQALKTAREALDNGELVCIFPEGGITRTGQVQAFRAGLMKIISGSDAPVVPVYLDGLWGSIFSFSDGGFFWKWPRRIRYPIDVHFGEPLEQPVDLHQIRQGVLELGAEAVQQRMERQPTLPEDFVRRCKQRKWALKISDSTGGTLTGGALLMRALILRRLLRREVLSDDEQHVGVLLPPSLGGVVVNSMLALDRRVSVNLNYTVSAEVLNQCMKQAGIRHVLTARRFLDKLPESVTNGLEGDLVCLEDYVDKVAFGDKLAGALQSYLLPANWLISKLGLSETQPDDVITIIFTSGSTGTPKGVMLTQANVAHNVDAINQVVHIKSTDVLLGILPFFHSFGYTVTMWGVLGLDIQGAYHFNPLDAKQVGKLCRTRQGTLLLATPTFLRSYVRRCPKEDFSTLDVVVTGAEKLPPDLADAFEQKFGVRPVEGYGTTELAPLVAVNVPPNRSTENFQEDSREGSVGRTVPNVAAKIMHLEEDRELGSDEPGMLMIKGPNVMKGYLGRDDLTAKVIRDGWYVTGDVAKVDEEGFIHITGRESRFSKIGGEMVPHILIEEALSRQVEHSEDEDDDQPPVRLAVTAVPDPKKGERLIVLHTTLDKSASELRRGLTEAGLPNLYIPSEDSFREVEQLPLLGTGKLDLKRIRELALEHFGDSSATG